MLTSSIIIEGGEAMPMKNPPHPGEMVGDIIAEMGLTIVDAAKGLGVTRQQLHNLIGGRSAVSPEMAYRLERALGSSADAWLRLQANYDLTRVRARAASIKVSRLGRAVA
jgi:addiction module HigA family antidote